MPKKQIEVAVYQTGNGMVICFNTKTGDQVPKYQGRAEKVMPKIKKAEAKGRIKIVKKEGW